MNFGQVWSDAGDVRFIGVQTNFLSLIARGALARATRESNTAMERLATGKKLSRASDDPSGAMTVTDLKVQEAKLRSQLQGIERESAFLGAKEGAHSVVADLLVELQEHVVAAANKDVLTEDELQAHQDEVDSILKTINRLADTAEFNGNRLMEGSHSHQLGVYFTTVKGPDGKIEHVTRSLADLMSGGEFDLLHGDMEEAQRTVKAAISSVSGVRAGIGIRMKDLDVDRRVSLAELEGISSARSEIEDADFGQETANLVRAQVMQQAALFTTQLAGELMAKTALSLLGAT